MALDPRIILGIQAPQLNDTMDTAVKAQSLRDSQSKNRLMDRHIQALDSADSRANMLSSIARESLNAKGEYDPAAHRANLMKAGMIDEGQAVQKGQLDEMQQARLAQSAKVEEALKTIEYSTRLYSGVKDQAGLDAANAEIARITPDAVSRLPKTYTPEAVKGVLDTAFTYKDKMLADHQTWSENFELNKFKADQQNEAANRDVTREANAKDEEWRRANFLQKQQQGDTANQIQGGATSFNQEQKLAADYQAESKNFVGVRDAYSRIKEALPTAHESSPATLAAGTMFMKLLDPGSVVRESELGMALNATGVWDKALNYANTLASGKVLTKSQVKEFSDMSDKLYEAANKNHASLVGQYKKRTSEYGLNPEHVVTDYNKGVNERPSTPSAPLTATNPNTGERMQSTDGGQSWHAIK